MLPKPTPFSPLRVDHLSASGGPRQQSTSCLQKSIGGPESASANNPSFAGSYIYIYIHSYRELGVSAASEAGSIDRHADVRADDRDVPSEASYRAEEVAEQDHDAVELNAEPNQWPS